MSRRGATFTQANVARALRAAEQVAPGRMMVEIAADGAIRILPIDRNSRRANGTPERPSPREEIDL